MPYGLDQAVIDQLMAIFARYPQVERAILYGSRAKGNYRNGSDIDLTLQGKGLDLHLLNSIGNEIDELLLPYVCDLSLYDQISNQELLSHIDRVGIPLF